MREEKSGDSAGKSYLSFWKAGKKYCLQTNDPETARKVRRWNFSRTIGRGFNCYLYIFSIPVRDQVKARENLGIPRFGEVLRMPVKEDLGR